MSSENAIRLGRRRAEAEMRFAKCIVRRKSGTVFNNTTGAEDPTFATVYNGKCKVTSSQIQASDVQAAGQTLITQGAVLALPVSGTETIEPDDEVEMTENQLDVGLVGVIYRIAGTHHVSLATARRFPIEEAP